MQAARIAAFLLTAGLVVSFVGAALAADDVPVMITDRPTISVSSRTVSRGYFQLETNIALNVDRIIQNRFDVEITSFDMINTLMRFGVSDRVELRLSTLYTFKSAETQRNSTSIDGINGVIVGAKIHLFAESGARPDAAVLVAHGVAVFAEIFGNAADGIDPMVSVDGGAAWQNRRNIQVDASGGIALTEEGNDWFGTAGFSFRLPQ